MFLFEGNTSTCSLSIEEVVGALSYYFARVDFFVSLAGMVQRMQMQWYVGICGALVSVLSVIHQG